VTTWSPEHHNLGRSLFQRIACLTGALLSRREITRIDVITMHTQSTKTFPQVTEEKLAILSRSRWDRLRTIAYWTFTVLLVAELAAGSLWNFLQIEWVRVQLNHLGYPLYLTYILGVCQIGGAAVIIAPGFPRLKEWAYAGSFFNFSGAVASHLLAGEGASAWLAPVVFSTFVIGSWALRPSDRRLTNAELAPETRPLAWAVPIAILLLLLVVAYLTLPVGPPPYYPAASQ